MTNDPWLPIAPQEEATGDLRRAYDLILSTRGRIPDIRSVMAREPLTVEGMAFFHPEDNYGCRSVDRRLAEMIATVASAANGSPFGTKAHADQLAKITDEAFARAIASDYTTAGLPANEQALMRYAAKLSATPGEMSREDIEGLRAVGWEDAQIVATVHIASFFAYMNRVAEAFGLTEA